MEYCMPAFVGVTLMLVRCRPERLKDYHTRIGIST